MRFKYDVVPTAPLKQRRPFIEQMENRLLLSTAEMVKDINAKTMDSEPSDFVQVGLTVFFVADDGSAGDFDPDGKVYSLFKTNGTSAGTTLIKRFNIDQADIQGARPLGLTELNGKLLFYAGDDTNGFEPWISDGTTAGTTRLKDINPGKGSSALNMSGPADPQITRIGNKAYFAAYDPTNGRRIWSTDGTTAGTAPVPIATGEPKPHAPDVLVAAGGQLFIGASDTSYNSGLWVLGTDGLQKLANAAMTKGVDTGGVLYFTEGTVLWRSDGTVAGTELLRDFGWTGAVDELTSVGGQLLFTAYDDEGGHELWKSNGTVAGTIQARDHWTGPDSSSPYAFTTIGSRVYFIASATNEPPAIWSTDATGNDAIRLLPIDTEAGLFAMKDLRGVGTNLYFTATTDSTGPEIFRIDTAASTPTLVQVTNFSNGGDLLPSPVVGTSVGVFFAARDLLYGREPFKTTGTIAGTTLLKDIITTSGSSNIERPDAPAGQPPYAALPDGRIVFGADNGSTGRELWISDGTDAGTKLLKDIFPDYDSSDPHYFTTVGSHVYFFARTNFDWGDTYYRLWKTDGGEAGTVQVSDVPVDSIWPLLFSSGNAVYFNADDGSSGVELWKTNGTPAGTSIVADMAPGWAGSFITEAAAHGGFLYLSGRTSDGGAPSLLKSSGTSAAPTVLKQFNEGDQPRNFTIHNGVLFFIAGAAGGTSASLWKTDGTPAGTVQILSGLSSVSGLTVANGALLFSADGSDGAGRELWRSNGTAVGTSRVRDIVVGSGSSSPAMLGVLGTSAMFRTASGQLWRSDGTESGTTLVTSTTQAASTNAAVFSGKLFFHGNGTGSTVGELWQSDGTAAGTTLVKDIYIGTKSSQPVAFSVLNDRLYFVANNGVKGRELWSVTSSTPPVVSDEIIVDNTAATLTGTWGTSSKISGYYGSNYLHDSNTGKGTKSVRFTPSITTAGTYAVYVRWISGSDRASNVPFDVTHAGGTSTVLKDQRTGGGSWQLLGTYTFSAGTAGSILLRTTGTSGYVIADAVRLVRQTSSTVEVIADNTAASTTGTWSASTSKAGFYGSNYLHDGNTAKGSKSVTWQASLPESGTYKVYGRWTSGTDRSSNARYDITHGGGTSSVYADQRSNGGVWVLLGEYTFTAGSASITLSNAGTSGYVIADAVRWVKA